MLFCQGCPWRCVYCHNPHLIPASVAPKYEWNQILDFLRRRVGLLDAVVFSGGEPTLQDGLVDAMRTVKRMGFSIGLHTAGLYPEKFTKILPLLDWVGIDVKAPFERYGPITGTLGNGEKVRESLRLLVESGVDHECRTTVHPSLFTAEELAALSASLFALGARRYVLQAFRPHGCRDATLAAADEAAVVRFIDQVVALAPRVERRGVRTPDIQSVVGGVPQSAATRAQWMAGVRAHSGRRGTG